MGESAESFIRFVRPHWRRMHLVARRYAGNDHDARDMVQEGLLRAWRNFSLTEERTYGRAWLFVILRNVAAEWHRAGKRRVNLVPMSDSELTELASADPADPFVPFPVMDEQRFREFLDDRIAGAFDALDAPFREVILLSVAGDLSYRDVAEVLDCPVGTVMSRMARARRELRERLGDYAKARGWAVERRK